MFWQILIHDEIVCVYVYSLFLYEKHELEGHYYMDGRIQNVI